MNHEWKVIKWQGSLPRYRCKNCEADVVEENGKFYYFLDRAKGPSESCDFEIVKNIMKS